MPYLVLGIVGNNICKSALECSLFNWSPKALKGKSRDQEQCRAGVAVVEERAQCYKALSDHAAQEISPEILLSPALHHDDQDQEEYDIQMIVNSGH